MADPVARLARRLASAAAPPAPAQRWEIADVLARVNAALARRAA